MWCERAQKDCTYLSVLDFCVESSAVHRGVGEYEEYYGEMEDVASAAINETEQRCTEDYCNAVGWTIRNTVLLRANQNFHENNRTLDQG
ncbi:MAG: hypothetical protein M3Q14_00410 [bacterium]|nr:hypothetical protein [bacterium]